MKKIQIIALLSALIMFICGYIFISSDNGNIGIGKGETISVVVAKQDIAPGTTLTSEMLTVKRMAASQGLTNYYTKVGDIAGSVCTSDVFSGEVITNNRIIKQDTAVGLATRLEKGMRAVSIEVGTEQGVANNLRVGNYVDVIFTAEVKSEGNNRSATAGMVMSQLFGEGDPANTHVVSDNLGQFFSVIVLQKIKIVALDDAFYFDSIAGGEDRHYGSVTLEVTPAQAAKIALLNGNQGEIQLVLRSQDDEETVNESRQNVLQLQAR